MIRGGFGRAEMFANKFKVTKSDGSGLRWVAEKEFYGEAADFGVSAADGAKEGGVRMAAESTRDVGSERSVFEVCDGRGGGVDGESRYRWWEGGGECVGYQGGGGEVGVGCGVCT